MATDFSYSLCIYRKVKSVFSEYLVHDLTGVLTTSFTVYLTNVIFTIPVFITDHMKATPPYFLSYSGLKGYGTYIDSNIWIFLLVRILNLVVNTYLLEGFVERLEIEDRLIK